MKVITLLSIFVLFFIINIIFTVSPKKNFKDSSNTAASKFINIIKRTLSKPVDTLSSETNVVDNTSG